MKKLLLAGLIIIMPFAAYAQSATQINNCSNAAPATGSSGLYVDSTGSLCVRGNLGGYQTNLVATPTVQAAAYATGNAVGGLITLANATKLPATGLIQTIGASFTSGVQPSLDVVFFSANPTGSTITDKTAVSVVAADLPKVIAVAHLSDTTLLGTTLPSYVEALQQAISFNAATGNTIYAAVIARSAFTLTSTTDMTLNIRILQD